ncbi:MAG TPA: YMGG-like glycine zipper-containing protein [Pyrinomonadaceae bacterium]
MNNIRFTLGLGLMCALLSAGLPASAQRRVATPPRRRAATTTTAPSRRTAATNAPRQTAKARPAAATTTVARKPSTTATRAPQTPARRKPAAHASQRAPQQPRARATTATMTPTDARLTGLYRLDPARSDDPRAAAERATNFLLPEEQERVAESLTARLTSPEQIAIERRGQTISIGSTRAPRVTFEADGRTRTEQAGDGHTVITRAALYGDQLMISSGSGDDEFSVNFDSLDNGTRLRVTRRISDPRVSQPVIVQSTYTKVSQVARFNIYGEPEATRTTTTASRRRDNQRDNQRQPQVPQVNERRTDERAEQPRRQTQTRPAPPVIRNEPRREPRPIDEGFVIGQGTQFVATLDNNLSTAEAREGDRFTMTVREPSMFAGATIEGTVSHVHAAGRISGRSELTLNFERIRLRDGRTATFDAEIDGVRPVGGEDVRVDNEGGGAVQEDDSRTNRTTERAAIGAAVGAIIGAISGGGKGAAIGAVIGAGAGAGSVYAQGRDHLELGAGTQFVLRAAGSR